MKEEYQQSMQKWRVGRRRHIKGRWRWYDNSCDRQWQVQFYNNYRRRRREETNTIKIKRQWWLCGDGDGDAWWCWWRLMSDNLLQI